MLTEKEIQKIIEFVKKEPRTIQDVSKLIGKSWVTAQTYTLKIKNQTGLLDIKTFRAGTQGALKIVYYNKPDSLKSDELKEVMFNQIKAGRNKNDFDFLEIYQFANNKNATTKKGISNLFYQAKEMIYCFSGNLSVVNENGALEAIECAAKRGVQIKILCRINLATVKNLAKLEKIIIKYPNIEIKHCYHPLRGFIIDNSIARFKTEENSYKKGELDGISKVFFEIYDEEWVIWLQKVFWNYFRTSLDAKERLKEIKKIF
jgi:hypothetical protein